ncbi:MULTISPECIES: cation-translocating P-type ATPase [Mesorhizobium]|uniref:Cadmium-translocating P-type ATPase n=1 Tax=Mesorhizobium denitrificans TaxID=2294114 RepID=A0A371XGC8_9HYPH|nr:MULTISPECIES: cation-translocating P-type ATPase [Mesorhizobium]RFC68276.1 cadmium-translocating P-type ATPase [Mesorhizobium denitrificans]
MTCCAPGADMALQAAGALPSDDEVVLSSRALGNGLHQVELAVPGVHCAACIQTIEKSLGKLPDVVSARVNLSTKRVSVQWVGEKLPPIVQTLVSVGYVPNLFSTEALASDKALSELIRAVAVSGFAAANIMLLSVSVWSGAEGSTRDLFHWISALIAIPALMFAGRIYYRSAWSALRQGRMNMDVPIAIGISMAYAMSLYETITHGHYAYFDASVTLLFFLLIGRTLDHVMRDRARSAVIGLARLQPQGAVVEEKNGRREYRPVSEIVEGSRLLVAVGERVPVDSIVESGQSDIDASIANGESAPQPVAPGKELHAGVLNLTGPLVLRALRPASSSFLAEMTRLMEVAEGGKARYRRIAERVSTLYAPVVHLTAILTFVGWIFATGDWHRSITVAIAVLIITCPCALGLAVPIVQVVAARRLFEGGVMMKDGSALERMVGVDTVVFDKTGTLTLGTPRLVNGREISPSKMAIASELATHSRHPVSKAIMAEGIGMGERFDEVHEVPGCGVKGLLGKDEWALGRAQWAAPKSLDANGTVLAKNGSEVARFVFDDRLRPDAKSVVAELAGRGVSVSMLSGDQEAQCDAVAARLGIDDYAAELLPADKVLRVQALAEEGRNVLMVGDGLNDAPALAAAKVSMAPATAADIGRNAADFVFLGDSLDAVPLAMEVAKGADRLIKENIGLAILYNALAVPIAILGYVTPLIAAIAMSASSLLVIGNALRLMRRKRRHKVAEVVAPLREALT